MPRYQLSVYAEKLPRGRIRQPNPYAVVTVSDGTHDGETLGKSETVYNTTDPDFTKVIFLETDASVNLPLRVSIFNDRNGVLLAEGIFEATEVFLAPGHFKVVKAQKGAK
jgi:hypothetical protein